MHNALGILLKQLNYQFLFRKCGIQHMLLLRGCVVVPFCCSSSFRWLSVPFICAEYPKVCLIQYLFEGLEHTIDVPCHGNVRKGGNPYTRTEASVMANLHAAVKEMAGGIMNVDSLSDFPRNRDQATYLRRGSSGKKGGRR